MCYRVGKPRAGGGARQTVVRFLSRRKRDDVYQARFALKGKSKDVYINEDLTPLRYAVMRRAKTSPQVKSVSTKHGQISCKMQDDSIKLIRTPDDLFDVGLDDIEYRDFKLFVM